MFSKGSDRRAWGSDRQGIKWKVARLDRVAANHGAKWEVDNCCRSIEPENEEINQGKIADIEVGVTGSIRAARYQIWG